MLKEVDFTFESYGPYSVFLNLLWRAEFRNISLIWLAEQ